MDRKIEEKTKHFMSVVEADADFHSMSIVGVIDALVTNSARVNVETLVLNFSWQLLE